jgi:hypothetical protein
MPIRLTASVGEHDVHVDSAPCRTVGDLHRRAESRDRGERIRVAQSDRERLAPTHRQPRDGTMWAIGHDAVKLPRQSNQ